MSLSFIDRMVEELIPTTDFCQGLLVFDDDSIVPKDLRLAYKIFKNANCLPPEVELRRDIVRLRDLIAVADDSEEREYLRRKLNFNILRLNLDGRSFPPEADSSGGGK